MLLFPPGRITLRRFNPNLTTPLEIRRRRKDSELTFSQRSFPSPLSLARFRTFWKALRTGTGIADIRPHDFRHMGATFGAQTGANAFLLRDYLGHATLGMSGGYVERVVDPIRDLAEKVAARVAAGLDGKSSGEVVTLPKIRGAAT